VEDVKDGGRLEVLMSPIGMLAILICKDFLDLHSSTSTLLQHVPLEWVLVPSYGGDSTLKAHRAKALEVAGKTTGTICLVANQRSVEIEEGKPLPGFVATPLRRRIINVGPAGGSVHIVVGSPPSGKTPKKIVRLEPWFKRP
jgi:hypothetical protein